MERKEPSTLNKTSPATGIINDDDQLFFHIPYHPRDISRQCIQNTYEKTCKKKDENGESFKSGIHNVHGHLF